MNYEFHKICLKLFSKKAANLNLFSKSLLKIHTNNKPSVDKIRNIGVIAHIDAGKTTLTESLLYLSGAIPSVGAVDDGNTITDYMALERERGITIQSAAITFNWNGMNINLIDTPGHVDFTLEVERCLRVLDGAQTLTVWHQASKFNIPSVFFINKMDKYKSNFKNSLDSVEKRLKAPVVPVIVPSFKESGGAEGYIDLLNRKYLQLTSSRVREIGWNNIAKNSYQEDYYFLQFEQLISTLSDVDNNFANLMLSVSSIYDIELKKIKQALRKLTVNRILFPICCGSALKNLSSVKPILDMIVDFLPSPDQSAFHKVGDIPDQIDVCAYVFKFVFMIFSVTHDLQSTHRSGPHQFYYVRVYKGCIDSKTKLLNTSTNHIQSNIKIFSVLGNIFEPIDKACEGSIAIITGLEQTKSGDTIVGMNRIYENNACRFNLPGIQAPAPVFFCAIEAPSQSQLSIFEKAVTQLTIEDPSLKFSFDAHTGQTILSCMGELHIEIIKDRFKREYGLNVFVGPLQTEYRELLKEKVEHFEILTVQRSNDLWCSINMLIEPLDLEAGFKFLGVILNSSGDEFLPLQTREDWLESVNNGCKIALYNGPIRGERVCNVKIYITDFQVSGNKIPTTLVSACASRCLTNALKKAVIELVEPVMLVEIAIMSDEFGHTNTPAVLSELSKRSANILSIEEFGDKGSTLLAKIPLSKTLGLSNTLRVSTSGLVSFHMKLIGYDKVVL